MRILSRLRLRTKLVLLMGLSILAVVGSIAGAASLLRERMLNDRVEQLAAAVNTTLGLAAALDAQVAAHQISREQAVEQLRRAVHAIRFDEGRGYVTAWTADGIVV